MVLTHGSHWKAAGCRDVIVPLAIALALPVPGVAQSTTTEEESAAVCSAPAARVVDLGISGISCRCSVTTEDDGRRTWTFLTEPEILGVEAGGPADGVLRKGDRVIGIDGRLITTPEGGYRWSTVGAGEVVNLRIRRDDRPRDVVFTAGAKCRSAPPDATSSAGRSPSAKSSRGAGGSVARGLLPDGWLGMGLSCSCDVDTASGTPAWTFRDEPVVRGITPDGPAAQAGFRPGDVIVRIGGLDIGSARGSAFFSGLRPGQHVEFVVRRDGELRTIEITARERPRGEIEGGEP